MELERAKAKITKWAFEQLINQPNPNNSDFFMVRALTMRLKTPKKIEELLKNNKYKKSGIINKVIEKMTDLSKQPEGTSDVLPSSPPDILSKQDRAKWNLLLTFIDHDRAHLGESEFVEHIQRLAFIIRKIAKAKELKIW